MSEMRKFALYNYDIYDMKLIATLILSILSCLAVYSQTPNDSLIKTVAVVDGLFFDKTVSAQSIMPGGSTMAILKDPDGAVVLGVYLPEGYVLDESVKAKAIPAERVQHAEKLLRDYHGRKPQTVSAYKGIGAKIGEPLVKFEYTDIDGNVWNNVKLKGKVYVINIWQSECGPCRREMPVLSTWKDRFPDVVFLSASRHNREEILPIAEQHKFTWTHLQEATDLVALVRQEGFPLTIVVDKDGIVRFAKVGATEDNQTEAVKVIEDLLSL